MLQLNIQQLQTVLFQPETDLRYFRFAIEKIGIPLVTPVQVGKACFGNEFQIRFWRIRTAENVCIDCQIHRRSLRYHHPAAVLQVKNLFPGAIRNRFEN